MCLVGTVGSGADQSGNLIANGGFEGGSGGWSWGQGIPEPGFVDREEPYKGEASYVMGLTGADGGRRMMTTVQIDPAMDYEFSLTLRGSDLPEGSIQIALLEWGTEKGEKLSPQGWVWVPGRRGARNLIVAGGTFDWKQFNVHIYRQGIKPSTKRVTLYIDRTSIGQGELGIDDVCLIPVEPIEYKKPAAATVKPTPPRRKPAPETRTKKPPAPVAEQKPPSKQVKLLLLDRGDSTERWSLSLGAEFPGAEGELSVEDMGERNVLKVVFDLSGGGRYVGARCSAKIERADALVFDLFGAGWGYFTATVTDTTGQAHHVGFHVNPGDWKRITLPLTKEKFTAHWGGANDGKIHFPLGNVRLAAATTKGGKGHFLLRDVAIAVAEPKRTWKIDVTTDQPGHVHFTDEPKVNVSATIGNRLRQQRQVPVTIEIVDLDRRKIASRKSVVPFAPWGSQAVELSIDSPGPGYFRVLVHVGDGALLEKGEGAFGVVPKPLRFGRRDPQSFFGMTLYDPASAARIGVHWHRHFHFWRYTEYNQGRYKHATEVIKRCLEAGIDVMMLLDYREPRWLKPKTGGDGLPTEEALRHYANWVRDAVRAHPNVAVFEIQNEPDLELGAQRNLPQEKAVEFYVRLAETAAPIIRREAPQALICGCSLSGHGYGRDNYPRTVLKHVGELLDIYGPHLSYASPRIFGPGLHALFPEENQEAKTHRLSLKLLKEVGLGQKKMWIGEKGWAIKDEAPLQGEISMSFASCAARSLIISKSVPGVEKYIWHMQADGGYSEGARYALWRGSPPQPMPGAIAYANVAWHLGHAEPVESLRMADDNVHVHVFGRSKTDTAVAALWSVDKPFVMNAKLPDGAAAFDLFGRNISTQNIKLTGAPVFFRTSGADVNALLARIKDADLAAGAPFEVISASFSNANTLRLGLVNRTASTLPVWSRIGDQRKRIILPAVVEPAWIEIGLAEPVTRRGGEPLHVTLSAGRAKPVRIAVNTDVLPVTPSSRITVDGQANDWEGAPVIVVDSRDRIQPPDPLGWRGPQDLSSRASLAWDDENLYLLVRVTDDKHVTPDLQGGGFPNGDSLQIAVDVMNDAYETAGFDDDDREYGVVVDAKGTHTHQTHPPDPSPDFQTAAKRTGNETVYEMAFPWSELGRKALPSMVFSLNFITNENDGAGRKYWMGLTPGIGGSKRPGQYRDFYLAQ